MLNKIILFLLLPFVCHCESVSIIVPCYYKHFPLLPKLLHHITLQTELPDEVVISVSEVEKLDPNFVKKVQNKKYPFKILFLFQNGQHFAGENRNFACAQATGDIFITQDADDIPHPQRVEVIKYMFEKFDVFQILHKFIYPYQNKGLSSWNTVNLNKIKTFLMTKEYMTECWVFGPLTNGEMAIRREVFESLHWSTNKTGEDVDFNREVLKKFKKTLIIDTPLIMYRQHFSNNVEPATKEQLQQRYNSPQ